MPIMVKEPDLENRLSEHAKRLSIPTTKGRLMIAITNEVISTADAEGRDCGDLLQELRERQRKAHQPTAA